MGNKWEDVWHVFSQATVDLFSVCTVNTVHVIIIELLQNSMMMTCTVLTVHKTRFSINRDHIQIQCKNSNNGVQQNLSLAELLWVCTVSSIWKLICVQFFFSGLKTVQDTIRLGEDPKCRLICLESKVFSLMKSKIQLPSTSKESKLVSHCVCHYWPWAVAFCYFTLVLISPPDVSPLLSFLVVEFVQFDDRTVHTMTFWFPAAHWVPSPCCLHWHINFFWQPSTESTQTGSVPYF